MNQMTQALAEAGVPLPTANERIWRYFKDHPKSTAVACASRLGMAAANVSGPTSDMAKRGLLKAEPVQMRIRSKGTSFAMRPILHYSAVGEKYAPEDFPMPRRASKKGKDRRDPVLTVVAPTPVVAEVVVPVPPPTPQFKSIDDMTVREARAVYEQLKTLFA